MWTALQKIWNCITFLSSQWGCFRRIVLLGKTYFVLKVFFLGGWGVLLFCFIGVFLKSSPLHNWWMQHWHFVGIFHRAKKTLWKVWCWVRTDKNELMICGVAIQNAACQWASWSRSIPVYTGQDPYLGSGVTCCQSKGMIRIVLVRCLCWIKSFACLRPILWFFKMLLCFSNLDPNI